MRAANYNTQIGLSYDELLNTLKNHISNNLPGEHPARIYTGYAYNAKEECWAPWRDYHNLLKEEPRFISDRALIVMNDSGVQKRVDAQKVFHEKITQALSERGIR